MGGENLATCHSPLLIPRASDGLGASSLPDGTDCNFSYLANVQITYFNDLAHQHNRPVSP